MIQSNSFEARIKGSLANEQVSEKYIELVLRKDTHGHYTYSGMQNRYLDFCAGFQAALASQAQQPTDLSEQLREYAGNSGYSHNDYADTMLAAASEIERLTASQTQQESKILSFDDNGQLVDKAQHTESQWIKTPPPQNEGEFLAAFYFKNRPHDAMRRVVRFVDKDVVLVGWLPLPPAPEGE